MQEATKVPKEEARVPHVLALLKVPWHQQQSHPHHARYRRTTWTLVSISQVLEKTVTQ